MVKKEEHKQEKNNQNIHYLDTQIGKIEYSDESIYNFPEGLYGYKEYKDYIIWSGEKYRPFKLLISVDDPHLFFPLINPKILMPDYKPNIKDVKDWEFMYTIVSMGDSQKDVTVNMRAPILLSKKEKWGKQIILTDSNYLIRHKIVNSIKSNGV
ncbi:MAG: flagellar assembly protein FliW [bacterium]